MRASHRGAYEHLWAEQKYAVLAASFGAFKSAASRFSARPPQFLGFLVHLARIADRPVGEWRNAWLHVYDHLRPHLSAVEQRRGIEGIVNDHPAVGEDMYRLALRSHESSLFGCRLFAARCRNFMDRQKTERAQLCLPRPQTGRGCPKRRLHDPACSVSYQSKK